jgi:hypothetical protein
VRYFGNDRRRRDRSTRIETPVSTLADMLNAQYRRFIPNRLPNIVSFGQVRVTRFDLGQTGPEKLNWIEVPSEA